MTQSSFAQIDRTKQPAPDPAPATAFPPYEEFTLKNGLKVFFVRDERPLVTLRMLVRGGNGNDGNLPGLTDAVAELLIKGTTTRTAQQFAQQIDFIGGHVSPSTSADAISISASGLRKHFDNVLALFADAVKSPAFPADELEKYRQDQISGLKSQKARSEFLADYAVNRVLYGNSPYGQMPSEEAFKMLTPEKLKTYYKAYFVPSNATIAVVGNFTKDELKSKLEAAFGNWKTGNAPTIKAPKFSPLKGRRIVLVDRPTSVQSSIRVIGKGPLFRDPDRPQTGVLNSILGGGTGLGNRLAANLRETHAYTYSPYSTFDGNMYMGHWLAAADVRNAVTDSALTETLKEIGRMQNEPVPQEELTRNIQSSVGNFLMSVADPTTTAVRVQSIDFYGLPKNYYQKLAAGYQATTADMVQSLSTKYLNSADLAIVVVGKASEVRQGLEKFGKVEVWDADLMPVNNAATAKAIGMTVEQIWDKMLTAMGGKEKMRAVKSLKTEAAILTENAGQKWDGTMVKVEEAPNRMYRSMDLGPYKIELVVNGTTARLGQGGPLRQMTGDELEKVLESSHIMSEAYVDDQNVKLSYNGEKMVEGHKVYVVDAAYPKSGSTIYYIDAKTFLPVMQESDGSESTQFSDWKGESGIMLPHLVKVDLGPQSKMTIDKIKYQVNGTVDESLFNK
ncbi:MAG: insulinase family protein [Candidatus Kapaibacterium sp.]